MPLNRRFWSFMGERFGFEKRLEKRRALRQTGKPRIEPLEGRLAPAFITVTTLSDGLSHGGTSLRDAISIAQPGDTIQFQAGLTGAIDLSTSESGQGELILDKDITIDGSGAAITIEGGKAPGVSTNSQPFYVFNPHTVVLNNLTIANGSQDPGTTVGGGIYNTGTLTVNNCTLVDNFAPLSGGGITNQGTLTLSNCTLEGNFAPIGGGIENEGTLTVSNCTLNGNWANSGSGAGIDNSGTLTVSNTTLAGNAAKIVGGGIYNSGTLTITNSTLSGNIAGWGAGTYDGVGIYCANSATLSLANTILANSSAGTDLDLNAGTLAAAQNNLIQSETGNPIQNGVNGNIVGQAPLLALLGYYGGPTQTFALLPGSPALGAGSPAAAAAAGLSTDQRGQPRTNNFTVDIGAFESSGFSLTINSGGGQKTPVNQPFANPVIVAVISNDGTPVSGGQLSLTAPPSGASATLTPQSVVVAVNGLASFTAVANSSSGSYVVTISAGDNSTSFVSLTNLGPPVAVDCTATTTRETPVMINVLANDSDPNGAALTVLSISNPSNGTDVLNADGSVLYSPNLNFQGTDSFQYTIGDSLGFTATANVTVTVTFVSRTCTWLGTHGPYWSDAANWDHLPEAGDSLFFTGTPEATINDLPADTALDFIDFNTVPSVNNWSVTGNEVVLSGGIGNGPSYAGPYNLSNVYDVVYLPVKLGAPAQIASSWGASLVLNAPVDNAGYNLDVFPSQNSNIFFNEDVTGSGGLQKDGTGTVRVTVGTSSYSGNTVIYRGLFSEMLNGSANSAITMKPFPAEFRVSSNVGATFTQPITVENSSAYTNWNPVDFVGPLTVSGSLTAASLNLAGADVTGVITLSASPSYLTGNGVLSGPIGEANPGTSLNVNAASPGTLILSGADTYTGVTAITGAVQMDSSMASQEVDALGLPYSQVSGTASIQNQLNIGTTTVANTLAPGDGSTTGTLTAGSVAFQNFSQFAVTLNGASAGAYDQLRVNGSVNLSANTSLHVSLGYTPQAGDQFIIIDNKGAGPINGIFSGLAEGGTLVVDNTTFSITYHGSDGNDVVLTALAPYFSNTALASPANPAVVDTSLSFAASFTASVRALTGMGTPTGTIQFEVDGTYAGALVALSSTGMAAFQAELSVGAHTVTALYSGDGDFRSSSGSLSEVVTVVNAANLQQVVSQENSVTIQANVPTDVNSLVAAVSALAPMPQTPVTVQVNLPSGMSGTDVTASPPAGMTLIIAGDGKSNTIVGKSPALTVSSGIVVVTGMILTTATDAPTILVTGGNLVLRGDTVDSSTGFADAAISITGGTVDLGTATDPGNNILNVNGNGSFLQNVTSSPVSAVGNTFEMNGVVVTAAVPSARDSSYSFVKNSNLNVAAPGVLASVSDQSGNVLSLQLVTGPQHGSLQLNADGSFTYTPAVGFVGADSFTYRVDDNSADSNVATVTLYEQGAVVNTNGSGPGSLRQAILDVNTNPGLGVISFVIPGAGTHTIQPLTQLPTVTNPVTIDGATQPGYAGTPLIVINGIQAGSSDGLTVTGGSTTIRGLVVNGFSGRGVVFMAQGGDILQGCYIGTDVTGASAVGNNLGVFVWDTANNTIGGPTPGEGNVISGNDAGFGVFLYNDGGSATSGNVVQGNLIGTNAAGTAALGNSSGGVLLNGATNNTIVGNVISSNQITGISLNVGSSGNTLVGNLIGTDITGTVPLQNSGAGIWVASSPDNTIGGTTSGSRNVVLGLGVDNGAGVRIDSSNNITVQGNYLGTDVTGSQAFTLPHPNDADILADGSSNISILDNVVAGGGYFGIHLYPTDDHVTIQGNRIGTNAAGTAALGNGGGAAGIYMEYGISNVLISGNLISGNIGSGIRVDNNGANVNHDITIQGNRIGTDVNGNYAIPNGYGIMMGAGNVTIGGTALGDGNLISGNTQTGIYVNNSAGSLPILVEGNRIGTDLTGSYAIGNGLGLVLSCVNTIVGRTTQAAGNLISGNGGGLVDYGNGNLIEGNWIGTDPTGTRALVNTNGGAGIFGTDNLLLDNVISGNGAFGVQLGGTSNEVAQNRIGTDPGGFFAVPNQGPGVTLQNSQDGLVLANVISGNAADGLDISDGGGSSGNQIQGNLIGTNAEGTSTTGTDGKPLGNGSDGVYIYYQTYNDNVIGGSRPGQGNVIAGNKSNGIIIYASSITIQGNAIGTSADGTLQLGNGGAGVFVSNGAQQDLIGGTAPGQANTIAFNALDGVFDQYGYGITIRGNCIHDNGGLGIDLFQGTGANHLQSYPVLMGAVAGTTTTISGTLSSAPNCTFTIDFYANPAANPSGYGDGQRYLGSTTVTTDASGNGSFMAGGLSSTNPGEIISATATDAAGDTSQFAADVTAGLMTTTISAPGITYGSTATVTVTVASPLGITTGNVVLTVDSTLQSTQVLSNGSSSFSVSGLAAGTHSLSASYAAQNGFPASAGTGTLIVAPYAFTYTIGSDTQVYGTAADLAHDLPASINTGINGETLAIAYSSTGDTATAHVASSPYAITATLSSSAGTLSDYNITLTNGVLTVHPFAFTYTIANDSQTYGTPANFAADLGTTINTGVKGENLNIAYSSTGDTASADAGNYGITGLLANGTGLTSDYNASLISGTLSVTPANQTISWSHPADIVYGTPLSSSQLNATVAVVGPALAGAVTYTPGTGTILNAGSNQTLTINVAATTDYNAASATVAINVIQAPLTVTANNSTKVYGATLPALTGTISGVVNSDNITVTYSTAATAASDVVGGGYPITATLNDPNGRLVNYLVTNNPGTLTIPPANQTITWTTPASVAYGTSLSNAQLNAAVSVIGPSSAGAVIYIPPAGTILNAGANQTLTVNVAATTDYYAATASVQITVNKDATSTGLVSSANPSVFGQTLGFTATVTISGPGAGTPTGTVTFKDGSTSLGTAPLVSGIAILAPGALTVGAHSITASYSGDGNFTGSTTATALTQTVNKDGTTATVVSSINPSIVGQSVTFTTTVTAGAPGSGTPTGNITFKDGAAALGTVTLSNGSVSFSTASLAAGTHSITVSYAGDGSFKASNSAALSQVVKIGTTTALATSVNPAVFGQSISLTATVTATSGSGTPAGSVTFMDGSTTLATVNLSGGVATFKTAKLAVGNHSITASYAGNNNYVASSAALTQTVNRATTSTTLVSSVNPSVYGQSVTFIATVAAVAPGAGQPTGTVTFTLPGTSLTTSLTAGKATLQVFGLLVGANAVTATYNSDGNFTSSAVTFTETVNQASTTTTVTTSINPSVVGQPLTLTATVAVVAPGAGQPSGTVTFFEGQQTLGSAPLSGGKASIFGTWMNAGNHLITASYSGDSNFKGSISPVKVQVVNPAATTTIVASSLNPSVVGQSVTFTATVTANAPGSGVPGGTVTFKDGAKTLGTGTLNASGQASFSISTLTVGNHSITAVYAATVNYKGSTSALLTQKVNAAPAVVLAALELPGSPVKLPVFVSVIHAAALDTPSIAMNPALATPGKTWERALLEARMLRSPAMRTTKSTILDLLFADLWQ